MTEARESSLAPRRAPGAWAAGLGLVALAVALAVLAVKTAGREPARCPAGAVALGTRCCGEGQRLVDGRCAGAPSRCPAGLDRTDAGCVAAPRAVVLGPGELAVGPVDWEAVGTVAPKTRPIEAFALDAFEATCVRWSACVAAKACPALADEGEPGQAATGMTAAEAEAFCAFEGGSVPTSDQLAFAAMGSERRRYPWGATGAVCRRAAWGLAEGPCATGDPRPDVAGMHPDGATPDGVHDLAGNAEEWARSDDGRGYVARGGSVRSSAAAELRGWSARPVDAAARSPVRGVRCVRALP